MEILGGGERGKERKGNGERREEEIENGRTVK